MQNPWNQKGLTLARPALLFNEYQFGTCFNASFNANRRKSIMANPRPVGTHLWSLWRDG